MMKSQKEVALRKAESSAEVSEVAVCGNCGGEARGGAGNTAGICEGAGPMLRLAHPFHTLTPTK